MDGDCAPLREIVELKDHHGALLLLDEAHSVGVVGPHGRGLAGELGLENRVDVQMGTLSKALGAAGGYVAGRRSLVDLLVNRARSFIYSTATPPPIAAAALAAVEFLERTPVSGDGSPCGPTSANSTRRCRLRRKFQIPNLNPKVRPRFRDSPLDRGRRTGRVEPLRAAGRGRVPCPRHPLPDRGPRNGRLRLTVTARHRPETIADLGRALGRLAG